MRCANLNRATFRTSRKLSLDTTVGVFRPVCQIVQGQHPWIEPAAIISMVAKSRISRRRRKRIGRTERPAGSPRPAPRPVEVLSPGLWRCPWRTRSQSIGELEHPFGLPVKALSTPQGSGHSRRIVLPVLEPSSQYSLVASPPLSGSMRGSEGPLRAHAAVRPATATGGEGGPGGKTRTAGLGEALGGSTAGSPTPSR